MDKLRILNLEKVCRICLFESEDTHLIFTEVETENFKLNVLQLLSKIADIGLLDCDELPNKVCGKCLEFLIEISKFLKLCLDSNKLIRTYHEEFKVPEFEVKEIKEEVIKDDFNDSIEDIQKDEDSSSDSSNYKDNPIDFEDDNLYKIDVTEKPPSDLNYYLQTLENGETEFACNLCPARFKYPPDFEKHIVTHGNEPFVCNGCKKPYKYYQYLLLHINYPKSNEINITQSEDLKNIKIGLNYYLKTQECGNDVFVCNLCSGRFFVSKDLNNHLKSHGDTPYFCSESQKMFKSYKQFLSHLRNYSTSNGEETHKKSKHEINFNVSTYYLKTFEDGQKMYACNLCEDRFNSSHELKEHLPLHGDKPYSCNECKKSYTQYYYLLNHVKLHDETRGFQCNLCDKSYRHRNSLIYHKMLHTGEKPHVCSVCKKAFRTSSALKEHIQIHSKERNYACNKCSKKFKTRSGLLEHSKIHKKQNSIQKESDVISEKKPSYALYPEYVKTLEDGKKVYECRLCVNQFETFRDLKIHLPSHGDKPHWCNECKQGFAKYSVLMVHSQRYHSLKRYQCDLCEKSYKEKGTLTIHKRFHRGEKPYLCSECGKAFRSSTELKTHLRSHTEGLNHMCNHCGKKYKRKESLWVHLQTHTERKLHKCSECPKEFYQLRILKRHQMTHTGLKPFVCNICQKAFNRKCNLQTHIKSHSGSRPHVCEVCHYGFTQAHSLRAHMLTHEKQQNNPSLLFTDEKVNSV